MSGSLGSWIVRLLLQHHEQYGADLTHVWEGSRLCQLTEFMTYRRPEDPRAQITARIADKTHTIRVAFDVDATDEFERSKYGEQPESLTSNLRSVFVLKRLRIRLEQPRARRALSRTPSLLNAHAGRAASVATGAGDLLPVVWLDVLDWEVLSGDRYDPIIAEHAQEVGRGDMAAEVSKVLRRWWTGEASSGEREAPASASDVLDDLPDGSIKREAAAAADDHALFDTDSYRITLEEFLAPYLGSGDGKKVKPIPDWIFEVPSAARAQLDAIQVFGVDAEGDATSPSSNQQAASGPRRNSSGLASSGTVPAQPASQKRDESQASSRSHNDITPPSPPLTEEREKSEIRSDGPSASRSPSTDTDRHPSFASHGPSAGPEAEDSSDGEMAIRPTAVRARLGRAAQLALESFADSQEKSARGGNVLPARRSAPPSETDEDGLSDYELEQRRKAKRARREQAFDLSRSSPSTIHTHETIRESNGSTDGSKPQSSESVSLIEAQRPVASTRPRYSDDSSKGVAAVPDDNTMSTLDRPSYDSSSEPSLKRRRLDARPSPHAEVHSLSSPTKAPAIYWPSDPSDSIRTSSPDDSSDTGPRILQSASDAPSKSAGSSGEQKPTDISVLDNSDKRVEPIGAVSGEKRKRPEGSALRENEPRTIKSEPNLAMVVDPVTRRSLPLGDADRGGGLCAGGSTSEARKIKPSRLPKLGGFKPDLRLKSGQSSAWLQRISSSLRRTSGQSSS